MGVGGMRERRIVAERTRNLSSSHYPIRMVVAWEEATQGGR